jgi:hypothetical protein
MISVLPGTALMNVKRGPKNAGQLALLTAIMVPHGRRISFAPKLLRRPRSGDPTMPTTSEIEAAARVLCRVAYFQLPANERICSADQWPDVDVEANGRGRLNTSHKRWETFGHEARLALEAAEFVRQKSPDTSDSD